MSVAVQFVFAAAFAAGTMLASVATINMLEYERGDPPVVGGIEPFEFTQGLNDPDPDLDGDMEMGPRMGRLVAEIVHGYRFEYGPLPARNLTNYMMAQKFVRDFLREPAYRDMRRRNKDEVASLFLMLVFRRTRVDAEVDTIMASRAMLEHHDGAQTWQAWYARLLGVSDDFGTHGVRWQHSWLLGWRKVRAPPVVGRPLG